MRDSKSKKIRLCGHIVEFSLSKNKNEKNKSNMSQIVLTIPVYLKHILSHLTSFENIKFKELSNFHNK